MYEVYDELKSKKMGEENGFMAIFPTLEEAKEYVATCAHLFDDPKAYYFRDVTTGEYVYNFDVKEEVYKVLEQDAKEKGMTVDELTKQVIEDYLDEQDEEVREEEVVVPGIGQLWLLDEDLIMLGSIEICGNSQIALINVDSGEVEFVYEDMEEAVQGLEFVAESLEEYVGEQVEEAISECEDEIIPEAKPEQDNSEPNTKEVKLENKSYQVNKKGKTTVLKVFQVDTSDGDLGDYRFELVYDADRFVGGTFQVDCYYGRDSSWSSPNTLCYSFCLGNYDTIQGEMGYWDYIRLNSFIEDHVDSKVGGKLVNIITEIDNYV